MANVRGSLWRTPFSVVSHGKKRCHLGADRDWDDDLGRAVLLVLWQTFTVTKVSIFPRLDANRAKYEIHMFLVPKSDVVPLEINRFRKAFKIIILSDGFILLSMYSAWLLQSRIVESLKMEL